MTFLISNVIFSQESMGCQGLKSKLCKRIHYKSSTLDTRSDSIDIIDQYLTFDFWQLDQTLKASARIEISAKVDNINSIRLDLLDLNVDSVIHETGPLNFEYDGLNLEIELFDNLLANESDSFTVYYNGSPTTDAAGFGGFYFSGEYAYNVGVGFAADPHNYGRTWFPCFDNFVERMTFEFEILTDSTHNAICSGEYIDSEIVGEDSLVHYWVMEESIPSYLNAIAIGEFDPVEQDFESILGYDIPVLLAGLSSEQSDIEASFMNLEGAFNSYEDAYGPYLWNKVGFSFVPFNSGAMEHASNIAYPKAFVNGNLNFETLMAHELSHHWWGNLVTCRTAEDMWINEGMASFSEFVFLEYVYDYETYIEAVVENHVDVLKTAHESDGGRLAISGIGHENTYGDHVYNKGADVAHVMRTYLGDDYFDLMKGFLQENEFQDVSSEDFRDYLNANSDVNMSDFFDQWVFNPGFPEFGVDFYSYSEDNDNYILDLTISQKQHYSNEIYTDVPMTIRVMNEDFEFEDFDEIIPNTEYAAQLLTSIKPDYVFLNPLNGISQAVLVDDLVLDDTGNEFLETSEFRLDIETLEEGDSIWFRIENHWVDPDPFEDDPLFNLSEDRFWRIRMQSSDTESLVTARVNYYGNEAAGTYIDEVFFENFELNNLTEDSLVLVYREDASMDWVEYSNYELNTQGASDNWVGYIKINELISGDFAWAYRWSSSTHIYEERDSKCLRFVPKEEAILIDCGNMRDYSIFDMSGKIIESKNCEGANRIEVSGLKNGNYLIYMDSDENNKHVLKFSIVK